MDIKELKRWLYIEIDRLGPHISDQPSYVEVRTLERVLNYILVKQELEKMEKYSRSKQ